MFTAKAVDLFCYLPTALAMGKVLRLTSFWYKTSSSTLKVEFSFAQCSAEWQQVVKIP